VEIAYIVLQVLIAILSFLIILFVLLHRGRGGGLSDMFGGGVTSNLSSSGVAEKNLNRITIWLVTLWAIALVVMAILTRIQAEAQPVVGA